MSRRENLTIASQRPCLSAGQPVDDIILDSEPDRLKAVTGTGPADTLAILDREQRPVCRALDEAALGHLDLVEEPELVGDLGCHVLDAVFWALKLKYPVSVEGNISTYWGGFWEYTEPKNETYPRSSIVRYNFPERDGLPPVDVTWWDGGLMPPRPKELEEGRRMGDDDGGLLFMYRKTADNLKRIYIYATLLLFVFGLLSAVLFSWLTGKGSEGNSGIFLTLIVAITVGQATYNIVKERSLSGWQKFTIPSALILLGIGIFAIMFNGVTALMADMPMVATPLPLSAVEIGFGIVFLVGFFIMKLGVYRSLPWVYVKLLNLSQPYKKSILQYKSKSV